MIKHNSTTRIIGFDFFKTIANEDQLVKIIPVGASGAGLESQMIGPSVLIKNLSAAQYRDLLSGLAYLEFWIEAIDHNTPTVNNRLYPEDEFIKGMDRLLHRVIRNGGVQPGEHEHPEIKADPKLSREENMSIISQRLLRIEPKNQSHYIFGTKTEGGKTFFGIRTNPSNPIIVNDMAIGKIPTFSIRTLGDFPLINGVNVAQNLIVITTDYVYNPANANSRVSSTNLKFVDSVNAVEVKLDLTAKVGNESIELFKLKDNEKFVMAIESDNTFALNIVSESADLTLDQITRLAFGDIF